MDDQFHARTDDDLFADEVEPIAQTGYTDDALFADELEHLPQDAHAQHTHMTSDTPQPTKNADEIAQQPPSAPAAPPTTAPAPPTGPKYLGQSRHARPPATQSRIPKTPLTNGNANSSAHTPTSNAPYNTKAPFSAPTGPASTQTSTSNPATATTASIDGSTGSPGSTAGGGGSESTSTAKPPPQAPTGPAVTTVGSASATGPARLGSGANPRTKLTEEQLSERIARLQLAAVERTRRFEAAERDQSSHDAIVEQEQRRRAAAAEARRLAGEVDNRKRQVMEAERQRNRERKLQAMGIKEGELWDEGRGDHQGARDETPRSFRGVYGSVRGSYSPRAGGGLANSRYASVGRGDEDYAGDAGAGAGGEEEYGEQGWGFRGRGRGGRGRGRGARGGGRGRRGGFYSGDEGREGGDGAQPPRFDPPKQSMPKTEDFPALPAQPKRADAKPETQPDALLPMVAPLGRWADEVEVAEDEAKS